MNMLLVSRGVAFVISIRIIQICLRHYFTASPYALCVASLGGIRCGLSLLQFRFVKVKQARRKVFVNELGSVDRWILLLSGRTSGTLLICSLSAILS